VTAGHSFDPTFAKVPTPLHHSIHNKQLQMSNSPISTRYSSLSLTEIVCLCAGPRDDEAWQEFVSRVRTPIRQAIARTAAPWGKPSRSMVEDLVQVTYLKLWEGGRSLLRDFALQYPESVLGYLKKIAANATHDYFKHGHSQSSGGDEPHVSASEVDPEAGTDVHGSEERIGFQLLLTEIDEHLKRCLTGPDRERDRTIFWLYFRQGMSTREIATLPGIGLGTKGVGSVIERMKHLIREQILRTEATSSLDRDASEKQSSAESRIEQKRSV